MALMGRLRLPKTEFKERTTAISQRCGTEDIPTR